MAFDGIFLSAVINEIKNQIINTRVDKIYQPNFSMLILSLRGNGTTKKLLINVNANDSRMHLTDEKYENPEKPPMFCMIMRKSLTNAKLVDIRQSEYERIAELIFETRNELFDTVTCKLKVEIMGRYSNIILCDENNIIIDSINHIDQNISSKRQVLPGLKYILPPAQSKLIIDSCKANEIKNLFCNINDSQLRLDKFILNSFMGFSPVISREIVYNAFKTTDKRFFEINNDGLDKLVFHILRLQDIIINKKYTPCIIKDVQNKKQIDFSYINISQYSSSAVTSNPKNLSSLLDEYYSQKSKQDSIRQKGGDLFKILASIIERTEKKLNIQKKELCESENKDIFKLYAELLTANIYKLDKGMNKAVVENYYDNNKTISIPMDVSKTPSQNSNFYYKKYRKAKNAEEYLKREIEKGIKELAYLDSVLDSLMRAENLAELNEIRIEMTEGGYIKSRNKNLKIQKSKPLEFISEDGFKIIVGKNNIQNEYVTFKMSRSGDIWLHAQKIPGSHTLIKTEGKEVPYTTLLYAAKLAAKNSKAKNSNTVPIDYTYVKNVKKIPGAKRAMVTYTNYKTLYPKI